MTDEVRLRDITERDLPVLFEQQRDPAYTYMAAFTAQDPANRDAFMAQWAKILSDGAVVKQTILWQGQIAGSIVSYLLIGEREVGYGLGREYWGRGIATAALRAFLEVVEERPLYARAAKDNAASLRVLQKCGFVISGEGKGYANGRGAETEEYLLTLPQSGGDAAS